MENIEIWKDIKYYEGIYQVSNFGNVKSLDRVYFNGQHNCVRKGKLMSNLTVSVGYNAVNLYLNKKATSILIHRLVAIAFIPNPEKKPQVNHINGVKTDNRVENLEWCTSSENLTHAVNNNLNTPTFGEINGMSKLTEKDVLEIREIGYSISRKEIAKKYNVSMPTISDIRNRKAWKHI